MFEPNPSPPVDDEVRGVPHRALRLPSVHHDELRIVSAGCLAFLDITDALQGAVADSGFSDGIAVVQSLHTTAAIVVNEAEPLLLEDLRALLERLVPRHAHYRHDDFSIRTVNMTPDEQPNGFAHCRALALPTSVTFGVRRSRIYLGRWQRVFFVELDRRRERTVAVTVLGACGT